MHTSFILAGIVLVTSGSLVRAQNPGPVGQLQNVPNLSEAKVGIKTYPEWLKALNAPDPAVKEAAMQAMIAYASEPTYWKQVRKEAVPTIIYVLNDPITTDASLKVNGALALGLIMPTRVGEQPDEKIIEQGVRCLMRLLNDYESVVRLYATTALANIGQDARAAVPILVKETKDKASWEIRRAAFAGLAKMAIEKVEKGKEPQGPDPRVFRAFTDGISDHCLQVKQEAIKGFLYTGPIFIPVDPLNPIKGNNAKIEYRRAVEALDGLLSPGRDKSTSALARLALMVIDPPTLSNPAKMNEHLRAMSRLLRRQEETQVRIDASFALKLAWEWVGNPKRQDRPDPKSFTPRSGWGEVIHAFVSNLDDRDETIVCWACYALGTMGEAATHGEAAKKTTLPALEKLKERVASRKEEDLTKKMAKWALDRCHGKEAGQVGALNRPGQ